MTQSGAGIAFALLRFFCLLFGEKRKQAAGKTRRLSETCGSGFMDYFFAAAFAALAFSFAAFSSRTAWAAANLATGTRKGLQLT